MASATMSSSSTIRSRTGHSLGVRLYHVSAETSEWPQRMAHRFRGNAHRFRTGTESDRLFRLRHLRITDRLMIRVARLGPISAEAAAPRRNQGANFRLVGFREGLGEQVRKTVRGTLREAREHLGIQIPILRLVL